MKTKNVDSNPTVIELHITHRQVFLLSIGILITIWLGYLLFFQHKANASSLSPQYMSSAGSRSFYLTTSEFDGDGADESNVCATGYHFASLWEMLDVSNLVYTTGIGMSEDDIGGGPPASLAGWVRTGYTANNTSTAGRANCSAWSSTAGYGTTVELISDWTSTTTLDLPPWNVNVHSCALTRPAWCVQD